MKTRIPRAIRPSERSRPIRGSGAARLSCWGAGLGLAMLAGVAWGPLAAAAGSLVLDASAGFDTNPAQSHRAEGLAFARYGLDADRAWGLGGGELGLGASAWYRDYEARNDSYRLALLADWTRGLEGGLGLLRFSAEGALYRDALVPADERDEAAMAIGYERTLSARDSVGLSAEVRRLAYLNASLPWAGRPGSGPDSGPGSGPGSGPDLGPASDVGFAAGDASPLSGPGAGGSTQPSRTGLARRRDDTLIGLGFDLTRHWGPDLATTLSLVWARCDSPVAVQAYDREGVGLRLRYGPSGRWGLEVGLGWSRTAYDRAPRGEERVDRERTLGLAVRRVLGWGQKGRGELYCGLDWLDSDSTIDNRSFGQEVAHCGLAWSPR